MRSRRAGPAFDDPCLATAWIAWIAWMLLGLLIITAVGRDMLPWSHQAWRLMHGVTAAAIALFGLIHVLRAGRYSSEPLLVAYWIAMAGLAMASLLGVNLLRPLRLMRHPLRIAARRPAAERCAEVVLEPVDHAGLPFRAGRSAWIRLHRSPVPMREHLVAIASAPAPDGQLRFLVKEGGGPAGTLHDRPVGGPA